MKRIIAVFLMLFLLSLPVSAKVLDAYDFENQDIEVLTENSNLTANGMIEFKLSASGNRQMLNIHILPSEEEIGKKTVRMNVPIHCRDMSLKGGVCFDVVVPEFEDRPRYIEFNLQFDMPGRAQTVAGQPVYYTDESGVTTAGSVQSGNVVRLDSGFKGRIYVPFAAFQSTAGASITSEQIYRMYMVFDCDLFEDYSFAIDNIGFYEAEDLPDVAEEAPPDFITIETDKNPGVTLEQKAPEVKPGTETITHKTDPDYQIITRLFYVLEWFDWLFIALGAVAAIGFTVWLIIFLKRRKKKKQNGLKTEV